MLHSASSFFRPFICALTLGGAAASVSAGVPVDTIKRKGGLWELNHSVDGMPNGSDTVQVCVDEKTDNLQNQISAGGKAKGQCKVSNSRRTEDGFKITSVCKMQGSTVTTDTTLSGKFDSAYHGDIRISANPPLAGVKQSHVSLNAKWLGACKPGQKAGDLIMSNGMVVNADGVPQKPSK